MIAAMKRSDINIFGTNAMARLQWTLSMLAIVACLFSVASVHSHESGLHALDSACISCDLEDVTSHGATVIAASATTENLSSIQPVAIQASGFTAVANSAASIRAPPLFS